jgi:hypothetical protein
VKEKSRFHQLEWIILTTLLLSLSVCGATGCASQYSLGGGPLWGQSMGGDQNSGIGGGIEIGYFHLRQSSALGAILSADYSGYQVGTDADPVLWAELDGLYRWFLGSPERDLRPFVSAGIGGGASIYHGIVGGLFLEAGGQLMAGPNLGLSFSLRERPAFFTGGSRFHNGVHVAVTLDLLTGPPAQRRIRSDRHGGSRGEKPKKRSRPRW